MAHAKKRSKRKTPQRKSTRSRKRSVKGAYYDEHFVESTTEPTNSNAVNSNGDVSSVTPEITEAATPGVVSLGVVDSVETPANAGNVSDTVTDSLNLQVKNTTPIGAVQQNNLSLRRELKLAMSVDSSLGGHSPFLECNV